MRVLILVKSQEPIPMYRTLEMISRDQTLTVCGVMVDNSKLTAQTLIREMANYCKKRGFTRMLLKIVSRSLPGDLGHRLEFEGTRRVHTYWPVSNLNFGKDAVWIWTSDPYDSAVISRLRDLEPDIALRASAFGIIKEPMLSLPRLGILSYHHGDLTKYRGGPPCLWEIWNGEKELGVTVQILDKGIDTGNIVLQKFYEVDHDMSINRYVDNVKLNTAHLAYEALKSIQSGEFNLKKPEKKGTLYTAPTVVQLARMHLMNLKRRGDCGERIRASRQYRDNNP
ncbi:MAG: hypothetical protein HQ553_07140 [Chloroflexi bacterium]|nr:hypothetical protein [Chloroflexota bacterium]